MRGKTSKILTLLYSTVLFVLLVGAGECTASEDKIEIPQKTVVVATINGTINPFSEDFIKTAIDKADKKKAEAVVIIIDTPGGLLVSTKEIVKNILNSEVPVISYVAPSGASATSAGAFIVLASHVAAMAPGTSIGAAHPVTAKGKVREGKAGEKIENFASSYIKSIARQRNRNEKWAVKAVTESSSVTWEYAVRNNIADLTAPNIGELLEKVDGLSVKVRDGTKKLSTSGAKIFTHRMTTRQKLGNILGSPNIAYLLLSLGSIGILMEIYNPGSVFPGVVGVISLIIAFTSLQMLPFNYAGLGLIATGSALMVLEIFMTSYGLLAIAGIISLLAGGILLFDTGQTGGLRVSYEILATVGATFGMFFAFVVYSIVRSSKISYLGGEGPTEGREGRVVDWHGSKGIVFVGGEYWKAESGDSLAKGKEVVVVGKEKGLKIKVKVKTGGISPDSAALPKKGEK